MDRRDNGSPGQPGISKRQEVEAVVNDIERAGLLENFGDVHASATFGSMLWSSDHPVGTTRGKTSRCLRITCGEQRDVVASSHKTFGQQGGNSSQGP